MRLFKLLSIMLLLSPSMGILRANSILEGKRILYIEREQYGRDHHNTATLFQYGEINEAKFEAMQGSAMRIYDVDSGAITTLVESKGGVVRDPELSYDGKKVIFAMRNSLEDDYHIYEINVDGSSLCQLTFASGVSDIDPLYLPDGGIVFSSTRQPKYCMCNRHIMCNLYRMNSDGSNVTQLGVSTLFEGHPTMLPDGRILYDRWEYVDRNFSNAQALWTVNPDGTKHSIYYGNNTSAPDGVIDGRIIPGTDLVAAIFGNCHDRPNGALVIIDRKRGVDGEQSVVKIWPAENRELIGAKPMATDVFRKISTLYEDPYPLDSRHLLVSRSIADTLDVLVTVKKKTGIVTQPLLQAKSSLNPKMALYLVDVESGEQKMILKGEKGLHDPMVIESRPIPNVLPSMRNYSDKSGRFYVQDVYEGTNMEGVERGVVKYLRVIESMEKRSYTASAWQGQGQLAPAMNWHNFDSKRVVGEVKVEEDGSANFEAPAGKFLYFQLLDKDKKMVQTMRSGVSLMPGEINGCIGCHEDRLDVPIPSSKLPQALKRPASKMTGWQGVAEPKAMGFMATVQPILDKNCVSCHDFDRDNRKKLVLAGDKNPYFNAAYINLYVSKAIKLIGGGPVQLQPAYKWGSHASKLTKIIDGEHHGVKLSQSERETLYAWMDLNGGYYPIYESAFDNTPAGRSPLTKEELEELYNLTKLNSNNLHGYWRKAQAQIAFDRPEESPCLDVVRADRAKYDRALELIQIGAERLKLTPRGDIEDEIVLCERHKKQVRRYIARMEDENVQNSCNIDPEQRRYDVKPSAK